MAELALVVSIVSVVFAGGMLVYARRADKRANEAHQLMKAAQQPKLRLHLVHHGEDLDPSIGNRWTATVENVGEKPVVKAIVMWLDDGGMFQLTEDLSGFPKHLSQGAAVEVTFDAVSFVKAAERDGNRIVRVAAVDLNYDDLATHDGVQSMYDRYHELA